MKKSAFIIFLTIILTLCSCLSSVPTTDNSESLNTGVSSSLDSTIDSVLGDSSVDLPPDSSFDSSLDSTFDSSLDSTFDSSIDSEWNDSSIFDSSIPDPDPDPDCSNGHVDENSDEICDVCYESVLVIIDFYAINDLHGKFVDSADYEGVGGLTTYIQNQTANDDYSILLSSGDMWQGGAESNLTHGNIVTEWMNEMGFVSMTIGNHEFDWGDQYIAENAQLADFPILAINIFDRETDELMPYCTPSVVVERGGIQIGIIGAIGDCYSSIASDKVQHVYFKTGSELTDLVKAESQRLRSEGVDVIVYSLHDGYGKNSSTPKQISNNSLSYYGAELSKDGHVDIVFEGHSHKYYILKDTYGVYHLQGGGDNSGMIQVETKYNTVTQEFGVNSAKSVSKSAYANLKNHEIIAKLTEKYKEEISKAYDVLGYNKSYRNSSELSSTLAMLYYELGVSEWGDEYDVVLGGGSFNARSPYNISAGDVTYSMLLSIFPFDNALVLCKIKGSDLLNRFINNSSYYTYYQAGLENKINSNSYYYIVTDKWSSLYAPNKITEVEDYHNPNYFARDLLADYIKNGGFAK